MILLLLSYFIVLVVFIIFSASGLYHLWRFGYVGDLTKLFMVIYIVVSASTIIITLLAMSFRPWPTSIS